MPGLHVFIVLALVHTSTQQKGADDELLKGFSELLSEFSNLNPKIRHSRSNNVPKVPVVNHTEKYTETDRNLESNKIVEERSVDKLVCSQLHSLN